MITDHEKVVEGKKGFFMARVVLRSSERTLSMPVGSIVIIFQKLPIKTLNMGITKNLEFPQSRHQTLLCHTKKQVKCIPDLYFPSNLA